MPRLSATEHEMFLEVDLRTDLNINFEVPDSTKHIIADAIVAQIKDRTQSGKPLGTASKFKHYSPNYAAKKGVGINDVDLTLSEDMLNAVSVEDIVGSNLIIGFDDPDVIPRAFNHQTGDTLPKRPFFGIQKNELRNIKREIKDVLRKDRKAAKTKNESLNGAVDATVDSVMKGLIKFG